MGRDQQKVDPIFGLPIEDEEPEGDAWAGEEGPAPGPDEGHPSEAPDEGHAEDGPDSEQQGHPGGQQQAGVESQPPKRLAGKYKTVEDLEKAYKELERKLGARDSEKDELRRRLEQLEQTLNQVALGLAPGIPPGVQGASYPFHAPVPQVPGTPPSPGGPPVPGGFPPGPLPPMGPTATGPVPVPGAGVGPALGVSGASAPTPPPEPDDSPEAQQAWLERFYGEPTKAIRDLIREEFERQWYRQGQALGQALAPYVAFIEEQRKRQELAKRLARFRDSHPDFDTYKDDFVRLLQEDQRVQDLVNYAPDPDKALEWVYTLAKARRLADQAEQASTSGPSTPEAPAPSPEATKRAARMPAPSGARTLPGQPSPEDIIRESIFGSANETQGVFD